MSNLPPPPPPGGGFPPPPAGGFPPPGGGPPPGAPGALAEWQDRLVSGLIDWVGPIVIAYLLSTVLGIIIDLNTSLWFNPTGIVVNLLAVAWILYNGYLAGQTGQSIGMKQSGLRLVGEQTGQPIGGNQGLVRNLLFLASAICCLFWPVVLIDALFPLWDAKKQTLRDKIAKSVVIKVG